QIEHELAGRCANRFRLEVDLANLDADRLIRLECVEFLPYSFTHGDDVAALGRGNPQADGRPAIVAEQTPRRILVAALQRRDVFQKQLTARSIRSDHQLEHILRGAESPPRINRNVLVTDANSTAVGGDVSLLELVVDMLFVDAELRQPLPGNLEENDFLLLGEKFYFLDVRHREQLPSEKIGKPPQFRL